MARSGTAVGAVGLPVRRLHLELTNRCNFRCEFCPDGRMTRPRGTMAPPMLDAVLAQAGDGIARQVHFHVMGEPALYPDLPGAVRLARGNGMEAWVTTNGSVLAAETLDALLAADLTHLTVSLQTPDARTFALRNAGPLGYDEYERRIVDTARKVLGDGRGTTLTVGFLANPLRRFLAPDAPRADVGLSGRELRTHLARWAERILRGTPFAAELPRVLARTRSAGILKENVIAVTDRVRFRVRALGDWAEHDGLPVFPARFGYCPGVVENFGILWNGDYVICCADFDGKTTMANFSSTPIREYLALPGVQRVAQGFRRFRVSHPHCARCLGGRRMPMSLFRQFGSIVYHKVYRRLYAESEATS